MIVKRHLLRLLTVFVLLNSSCSAELLERILVNAIGEFLKEKFVKNCEMYDIVFFGSQISRTPFISNILKDANRYRSPYRLVQLNNQTNVELNDSAVLAFESFKVYQEFVGRINLTNQYYKPLTLLTFWPNATSEEVLRSISVPELFQNQVFIVVDTDGFIDLKSVTLFSQTLCHQPQTMLLNRFSKDKNNWNTSIFTPQAVTSFYGCPLYLGVQINRAPSSSCFRYNNELGFKCVGYSINLLEIFEKNLEFKAVMNPVDVFTMYYLFPHVTRNYTMWMLELNSEAPYPVFFSDPFEFSNWIIVVPPGELYTPLEKLVLPFDFETWMWFSFFIIAAIIVINIVKLMPVTVQSFVFGQNVTTPMFNLG